MNTQVTPVAPKTVNRLTQAQNFRLCSWLQKIAEAGALTPSTTYEGLTVNACAELGFHLTKNNIVGAFEATELKLPEAPVAAEVAMQRRVQKLEAMMRMLCDELKVPCQL